MASTVMNPNQLTPSPFYNLPDDYFLSNEELVALYESRESMLVLFDTIYPPQYHCSYRFTDPIPKATAYSFYGPNEEVSLLELMSGKTEVLDGGRCYPIWKEGVENRDICPVAIMNVIKEPRRLNEVQRLQLATYCNIHGRNTRMSTLWEKVQVTFAFYSALMDTYEANGDLGTLSEMNAGICCPITTIIGKALWSASLFDDLFPPPIQQKDIAYVESLVTLTIRGCLQLSIEQRLLEAIKYLCDVAPSYARSYFSRQFFYDLRAPWFKSAPLLKQILLIFVLPTFEYYGPARSDYDDMCNVTLNGNEHPAVTRIKMRACVVSICDKMTSVLFTCAFQALEKPGQNQDVTNNHVPVVRKEKADLDLPFIGEVAFQIAAAARKAEHEVCQGNGAAAVDENLEDSVIYSVKESINKYTMTVPQDKMYYLFK